jgi:nucleoside-diphosphate-sugar epimerase
MILFGQYRQAMTCIIFGAISGAFDLAKNILVVGATGYIGRHIAARMAQDGHQITAYVRSEEASAAVRTLGYQSCIGAIEDIASQIAGHDAVIFAPQLAHDIEGVVVDSILKAMRDSDGTFIFTSGTGVFAEITNGEWSQTSFSESDDFTPSPFAEHRVRTESRVRAAGNTRLRTIVIRPPAVFGQGGSRHVSFIRKSVALTGAACFIGRGLNLYSNVHIDDLSNLYSLALLLGRNGAVYHAVGGEADFRTIAAAVASVEKCAVRSVSPQEAEEMWDVRPAQFMFNVCSRSRAELSRSQLGWRPGPIEMIEDILANANYTR